MKSLPQSMRKQLISGAPLRGERPKWLTGYSTDGEGGCLLWNQTAKIAQARRALLSKPAEESRQPFTTVIDLEDEGQVIVPALPLDLIDTNGCNTTKVSVSASFAQTGRYVMGIKNRC
jgi:hypothetical protein